MSDPDKSVECRDHGTTPATFVCRHLATGVACGYWPADDAGDDPWPDAWCDACEGVVQHEGDWTPAAMAFCDLTLLCTHCYDEARARNASIAAVEDLDAPATVMQRVLFVRDCARRAQVRNELADETYGLNDFGTWDFDDEAATLTFHNDGVVGLVADVQLIGSYSNNTHTWSWSWAVDSRSHLIHAARRLRVFGEVRGFGFLTADEPQSVEIEDAWEYAAVAAALFDAEAIYRMPDEHLFYFLLLRNLRRVS